MQYSRLLASSCRLSVRPSVTLCIFALGVDVQEQEFVTSVLIHICLFRHFWKRTHHLATKRTENESKKTRT